MHPDESRIVNGRSSNLYYTSLFLFLAGAIKYPLLRARCASIIVVMVESENKFAV